MYSLVCMQISPLLFPFLYMCKGKKADISWRYYWFLREMTPEENAEKFHSDDTSCELCSWLDEANFLPINSSTQQLISCDVTWDLLFLTCQVEITMISFNILHFPFSRFSKCWQKQVKKTVYNSWLLVTLACETVWLSAKYCRCHATIFLDGRK